MTLEVKNKNQFESMLSIKILTDDTGFTKCRWEMKRRKHFFENFEFISTFLYFLFIYGIFPKWNMFAKYISFYFNFTYVLIT